MENLDCMSEDELVKLATMDFGVRAARLAKHLFPDEHGKGVYRAAKDIRNYCWNKATAMELRLDGNIERALSYEAICDRIYDGLPEYAKW